jgi:hypothetical protein
MASIGRYATNGYEPRQIRKEAAVNNAVCVVSTSNVWFRQRTLPALTRERMHGQGFLGHPKFNELKR